MAMVSLEQRWCGSSTPVNMLSTDELHLLEPLDATAPLAAHMFHELRRLGYKVVVGWVVRPRGWGAPPMVEEADPGSWSPDPAAPAPCFSRPRAGSGLAAAQRRTLAATSLT